LHRNKDIDNMKKKTIDRDEKMRRSKRDKPNVAADLSSDENITN
jgi:hypothetical protein